MRHTIPWSVKGVDQDAKEAAKEAARRSGMSLGEWLNTVIAEQAADAAPEDQDSGLATVTRRLESISQRLDAVTRRESATAIPAASVARTDQTDIVRALDAVARLAEISERRSAAAIEAVERIGSRPAATPGMAAPLPQAAPRQDHSAELDAIARSIRNLDMPAPRRQPIEPPAARRGLRGDIDSSMAEIAARQHALAGSRGAPAVAAAPPPVTIAAPPLAPAQPITLDLSPIANRLDALSRQIDTVLAQARPAAKPADAQLAGEIGRLSQRIDTLAAPVSDGLHGEIRSLSGRIEQMRRELAARETGQHDHAVAGLRADIAAMAEQLADLAPRRAVESLEAEVHALADRLHEIRAKGLPAEPLQDLIGEFERTISRLMPAEGIAEELRDMSRRIDDLSARGMSQAQVARLADETFAIRSMLADTVSRDVVDALGAQIAALGRRIDDMAHEIAEERARPAPASDVTAITAAIEARIDEIADRLAAAPRPAVPAASNPQLEEALRRLADKLEDSHTRPDDPKALAEIERHILSLAAKIDAADGRFAQLGTIERGLSDLFVQMEEMRASAVEAAERAARQAVAAANAGAAPSEGEIEALRREIAEVRRAREALDAAPAAQTVDAVQQTFERVARRIAEIEPTAAPAAAEPAPSTARTEPATDRRAATPVVAERAASPVARQGAPSRPPGSVDLPLEPGSGAPRVRPPAAGATQSASATKTDFIAAARRAAKAAAAEPTQRDNSADAPAKAGFLARFRGGAKAVPTDEATPAKEPRFRLPGMGSKAAAAKVEPEVETVQAAAPAAAPAAEPVIAIDAAERPVVSVNRKTLLMGIAAALLVLAAGIATMPKIRSLIDATGQQQVTAPRAAGEAPAATAPAAAPAPAAATITSAPAEATPAADPAPTPPAAETAPETTGSVARTPPTGAGTTLSPSGWQPIDTRTGRPVTIPPALKAAADAGDPIAAFELGTRYLEGRGVAVSASEAARWYQRAADAGVVPAQYRLGSLYEKGTGVLRDFERARRLYERSGEAGNAKAMHNLAVMYAQGQITQRPDYRAAATWFRRAAEHGVADSQYNLGILYARGLGVEQSLAESYKWFALAAAGGDQDAGKKRDEVAARIDAQTLVAARLAVQTFSAKTEPDQAVRVAAPAEWSDAPADPAQPARPAPRRAQSTR
ncbi:hypothetical protein [Phreatobacter sp.]|uniref:hypothetical protein n=1 Tax=Phreatobacter sp. TaxID=1966341 RepID=UPI0022C030D8|nr:hypothetical protein [Phreatobacter sp.]MCZ8315413.1 hypothetical protein [Phreatobacter sp.]